MGVRGWPPFGRFLRVWIPGKDARRTHGQNPATRVENGAIWCKLRPKTIWAPDHLGPIWARTIWAPFGPRTIWARAIWAPFGSMGPSGFFSATPVLWSQGPKGPQWGPICFNDPTAQMLPLPVSRAPVSVGRAPPLQQQGPLRAHKFSESTQVL